MTNAELICRIMCGTVAAAALAMPCAAVDVTVTPGFDFTNVVVSVSGAPGAQFSLVDSANSPVAANASLGHPLRGRPAAGGYAQ